MAQKKKVWLKATGKVSQIGLRLGGYSLVHIGKKGLRLDQDHVKRELTLVMLMYAYSNDHEVTVKYDKGNSIISEVWLLDK